MNIICIGSDALELRQLTRQIRLLMPDAAVYGCEKPHIDGFMLAKKVQKINPCVNIIFLTGRADEKCAVEAYRLHASGYLEKPYEAAQLETEFANLRYPVTVHSYSGNIQEGT